MRSGTRLLHLKKDLRHGKQADHHGYDGQPVFELEQPKTVARFPGDGIHTYGAEHNAQKGGSYPLKQGFSREDGNHGHGEQKKAA